MRSIVRVMVFCVLIFPIFRVLDAQQTGEIRGKLTDERGDALPGVTISAKGPRLQGTRTALSDPEGAFRLPLTDKYLAERDDWIISPCKQCGYSEILDAPSELYPVIFPNKSDTEVCFSFTSSCWACREGCQVMQSKTFLAEHGH